MQFEEKHPKQKVSSIKDAHLDPLRDTYIPLGAPLDLSVRNVHLHWSWFYIRK